MLENKPSQSIMTELLGQSLYHIWQALCSAIDEKYDMEQITAIRLDHRLCRWFG